MRKPLRKASLGSARKPRPRPARKPRSVSPITAPIQLLIDQARRKQALRHDSKLGLHHWVMALRDLFPTLPRDLAWDEMKAFDVRSRLRQGDVGKPLTVQAMMSKATKLAQRERRELPTIEDVVLAILDEIDLTPPACEPETPAAGPPAAPPPPAEPAPSVVEGTSQRAPATPLIERFGRDLTAEARAGVITPVIGRQEQIALMIETLCRRTRRNTALVGPPGVGKRAIVEGLAQRIAQNAVPAPIAGLRIIEIQLPALLAGVNSLPELDERFAGILAEARSLGIVLFFDELRAITPAGHDGLTLAISNQLKPEIARGEITIIISGAEEDFMRFVELDASLRPWFRHWFQPIRIDELSAEKTVEVLDLFATHIRKMTGVAVSPAVQKWIVEFAGDMLRSHRFPGKAIDLLEQCVAHAITKGTGRVTPADARAVAERSIAMPSDVESRLRRIAKLVASIGLLSDDDQHAIVDRLSVTLRSLDLIPARPNASILLAGEAAVGGRVLAETLADGIAGSSQRVIALDFGLLTEPWDMRQILGIAGSKVQPTGDLPLHALLEEPWSVVLAENVDACHAQVRTSLTRALSEGYLTDAKGKKVYLSDAVVVLTAPSIDTKAARPVGFGAMEGAPDARTVAAKVLDPDLVEQMDLVIAHIDRAADLVRLARHGSLLADLARRYRDRGLVITWDKSLVDWLTTVPPDGRSDKDWEKWADRNLASALIPHLPGHRPGGQKRVIVKHEGDRIVVGDAQAAARVPAAGKR